MLKEIKNSTKHFFVDDQNRMQGEYTELYHSGELAERAQYVDGLRHGLTEFWYINGQQWKKIDFEAGVFHGIFDCWNDEGQQVYRGEFVNGVSIGECNTWYWNGQMHEQIFYSNAKEIEKKEWDKDGNLISHIVHEDGMVINKVTQVIS